MQPLFWLRLMLARHVAPVIFPAMRAVSEGLADISLRHVIGRP
jgi:hypothetical protein